MSPYEDELNILNQEYSRGEISTAEYNSRLKDIESESDYHAM